MIETNSSSNAAGPLVCLMGSGLGVSQAYKSLGPRGGWEFIDDSRLLSKGPLGRWARSLLGEPWPLSFYNLDIWELLPSGICNISLEKDFITVAFYVCICIFIFRRKSNRPVVI